MQEGDTEGSDKRTESNFAVEMDGYKGISMRGCFRTKGRQQQSKRKATTLAETQKQ